MITNGIGSGSRQTIRVDSGQDRSHEIIHEIALNKLYVISGGNGGMNAYQRAGYKKDSTLLINKIKELPYQQKTQIATSINEAIRDANSDLTVKGLTSLLPMIIAFGALIPTAIVIAIIVACLAPVTAIILSVVVAAIAIGAVSLVVGAGVKNMVALCREEDSLKEAFHDFCKEIEIEENSH